LVDKARRLAGYRPLKPQKSCVYAHTYSVYTRYYQQGPYIPYIQSRAVHIDAGLAGQNHTHTVYAHDTISKSNSIHSHAQCITYICRVGQNHTHMVYTKCFQQEPYHTYRHVLCIRRVPGQRYRPATSPLFTANVYN
jgi:hypothetical protein